MSTVIRVYADGALVTRDAEEHYDDITRPARTALFDAAKALDRLTNHSNRNVASAARRAMEKVREARIIMFEGNRG